MKKWVSFLAILYCLRSDGAYVAFEGMTQTGVDTMLSQQGLSCSYLTADAYNSGVASVQAAQAATRAAQQAAFAPYWTELSTTVAAVAASAPNYVAASALSQIQVNKNMARIIQLRVLLGLQ